MEEEIKNGLEEAKEVNEVKEVNEAKIIEETEFKQKKQNASKRIQDLVFEKNQLKEKVDNLNKELGKITELEEEKAKYEQELLNLKNKNEEVLKMSKFQLIASKHGVIDDAVSDIIALTDFNSIEKNEDGTYNFDEKIAEIKEKKPWFFNETKRDIGLTGVSSNKNKVQKTIDQEIEEAEKNGDIKRSISLKTKKYVFKN